MGIVNDFILGLVIAVPIVAVWAVYGIWEDANSRDNNVTIEQCRDAMVRYNNRHGDYQVKNIKAEIHPVHGCVWVMENGIVTRLHNSVFK